MVSMARPFFYIKKTTSYARGFKKVEADEYGIKNSFMQNRNGFANRNNMRKLFKLNDANSLSDTKMNCKCICIRAEVPQTDNIEKIKVDIGEILRKLCKRHRDY